MTSTMLPPMPAADPATQAEMVRRLRKIGEKYRETVTQRDAIIRDAIAAGLSLREVGELVGLSHAGVARVVARGGVV